ncbi:MAG: hypothetical protein LBI04_04210 [Treponema sp.]|nr:hypothetical protein [Treponema sp.]
MNMKKIFLLTVILSVIGVSSLFAQSATREGITIYASNSSSGSSIFYDNSRSQNAIVEFTVTYKDGTNQKLIDTASANVKGGLLRGQNPGNISRITITKVTFQRG